MRYATKTLLLRMIAVSLFFLLSGCANTTDILENVSDAIKNPTFLHRNIKTFDVLSEAEVPADVRLSVAALVLKMRHQNPPSQLVTFDKKGMHLIQENYFRYAGFRWNSMTISSYNITRQSSDEENIHIEGALYFSDQVGRFTSSTFSISYKLLKQKYILIQHSEIVDNFPLKPIIKTYFVPLSAIRKIHKKMSSFTEIYLFSQKHAIPMRANDVELAEYEKLNLLDKIKGEGQSKSIKGEFVAMVFCMNRLPDQGQLILDVTDSAGKSILKNRDDPMYLDYSGWQAGLIEFQGEVRSSKRSFQVKAYHQNNQRKKLIGRFKSSLSYKESTDFMGAPLTKKNILLNLNVKDNAKLIQARLYALGYYSGAIDGLFGKGSRRALQKFNQSSLKNNSSQWDLTTQKHLFKNTGL